MTQFIKRSVKILLTWLVSFLILLGTLAAETVEIPLAEIPPIIDGNLDDQAWQSAAVFTDFKTLMPDFGLPPSEKTEVYLIYDAENIYVGFRCFDKEPEKIKATLARRDSAFYDDWIAFCVDSTNDELGALFFMTNPLGIQADGTLDSDGNPDVSLDLVWSSSGKISANGYTVELSIPFNSIRFSQKEKVIMGFKAARNIPRKSEEVDFPEYHPEKGAALAQFQKIEFSGILNKRVFEVLPATTFNKRYNHTGGYLKSQNENKDFSLTSKIGLSSNMMLDATYNPDFSQVETDAGQIDVNLRYALFYPEKRPFFLEGQEWFSFGARMDNMPLNAVVHTRNIVDPLLGFKLTGKLGLQDTLYMLYAQDEYPKYDDSSRINESSLGKNAHFSILRYLHRLKNDSYLGGFYTGRNLSRSYNYVGGADGRIRINQKSFIEYHGFTSFSRELDSTDIHKGSALGIVYNYNSRRLNMHLGMLDISRDFKTDTGYITRTGITLMPLYAGYTFHLSSGWLQRVEPYYWSRNGKDSFTGFYENFNVLGLSFSMIKQTTIALSAWLANEVYAGQKFQRDAFRLEAESQIWKQLFFECRIHKGKFIYYDSSTPYQGKGLDAWFNLVFQPLGNISTGFDVTYSDFYRYDNSLKVYDYTIFRNRTIFQLNKYLFFRGVLEYNSYWKEINADFLASFTYIPGTVIYVGYGSLYEKVKWQEKNYIPADRYLQTRRSFFIKASYLWRF